MSGLVAAAGAVTAAYLVYAPGTDLWSRFGDRRVLRRGLPEVGGRGGTRAPAGVSGAAVALTFDDGPDPRYTGRVLDILREHGVRAAFFLVGERARRHPGLVRRMMAEGHLVGSHTEHHRHAYLLLPWAAWREVTHGAESVAAAAGVRPRWFRPPWGAFNLATRVAATATGQRPVLWSITGGDWSRKETARRIADRVTRRLHPGAVIVLHDAGGAPGAPENTVAALPTIIETARRRGFRWVRLDELVP
ncbi:polysaccharide deacetylase family protein [Thermaerobacter marianensis]|uniref:polysaccharide deacetylase family protein n=1 Tax=Thermaerobacter marianensis TaxID=73919 RepID=UPI0002EDFF4C|nr:polysaccharide deacetylase family protein [Thermaerobacter marianensis]